MSAAVIAVAALLLLGLVAFAAHVLRGSRADELDADTAEWFADLSRPPTRAERRTRRAYLETALGQHYTPVRRHHGRRA